MHWLIKHITWNYQMLSFCHIGFRFLNHEINTNYCQLNAFCSPSWSCLLAAASPEVSAVMEVDVLPSNSTFYTLTFNNIHDCFCVNVCASVLLQLVLFAHSGHSSVAQAVHCIAPEVPFTQATRRVAPLRVGSMYPCVFWDTSVVHERSCIHFNYPMVFIMWLATFYYWFP